MMFSKTTPVVLATLFIGFTLGGTAFACSTDGWDGGTSGAVGVGQPFGATPPDLNGISRFEEFCALQATDTGYVQSNAASHSEVTTRFYVYPNLEGNGNTEILIGYSDETGTSELFNVGFDGVNFTFNTTGGDSTSLGAFAGWNLIEFHWNSDANTMDIWVNSDATMDPPDATLNNVGGSATLDSIRLGLPNGLGGFSGGELLADSVEMHNTTAIGPLLHCDADASDTLSVSDILAQIDEIFTNPPVLAPGVPDCDFSGGPLTVSDILAAIDVIF